MHPPHSCEWGGCFFVGNNYLHSRLESGEVSPLAGSVWVKIP